jgi:hypothetical protein
MLCSSFASISTSINMVVDHEHMSKREIECYYYSLVPVACSKVIMVFEVLLIFYHEYLAEQCCPMITLLVRSVGLD